MLEVREARISNFKGQLVFKMTKDAEPTMEKCVVCGRGADVILEKKFMVRICHGCQEVTAATSDTQPPAVPGSGAAGGGGAEHSSSFADTTIVGLPLCLLVN